MNVVITSAILVLVFGAIIALLFVIAWVLVAVGGKAWKEFRQP